MTAADVALDGGLQAVRIRREMESQAQQVMPVMATGHGAVADA